MCSLRQLLTAIPFTINFLLGKISIIIYIVYIRTAAFGSNQVHIPIYGNNIFIIGIKIINILLRLITHTIACYCKPDRRGIPVYTRITVYDNRNLPIA